MSSVGGDMSSNGSRDRIFIFVLVLNLVFPVLGYTFTTFGVSPEEYELDLDPNSLMMIGINFIDAESHTLEYNGGWTEFVLLNVSIRVQFMDDVKDPWWTSVGDGIGFQKESPISKAFDSWYVPYRIAVKSVITNKWSKLITNETLIRDFEFYYNWSRFILSDGHNVFVTPFDPDGNMTKAVFDDGKLNVTIAKSFEADQTSFNFWSFLGWYSSILIGDTAWGLPSVFAWFLRILAAISIFSVVMLTKELIRL